jgi:hypothetical protein
MIKRHQLFISNGFFFISLLFGWALNVNASNNSTFVSQDVPLQQIPGELRQVTVTMRNTGTTNWTKAENYRLGSPLGKEWGVTGVDLSPNDVIAQGQTKTFSFTTTSPGTAGFYAFQWQMLQEGVSWFGERTFAQSVSVGYRRQPNNADFLRGRFGISSHYIAPSTSTLQAFANQFDVATVAQQTAQAGASWFLFPIHHQTKMMMAPNNTYDSFMGNSLYTSTRDVPLAFYDELNKRGIRLMLYFNLRFDLESTCPPEVRTALGGAGERPNQAMVDKLVAIYGELSRRYGMKVSGWWVDGVAPWREFGHSVDREKYFSQIAAALREGNPAAVVSFNGGGSRVIRYSDHADYTAGDNGYREYLPGDGPLVDGVQWHSWVFLGPTWGADGLRYEDPAAAAHFRDYIAQLENANGAITIDVGTRSEARRGPLRGSIDPLQVEQLRFVTGGTPAPRRPARRPAPRPCPPGSSSGAAPAPRGGPASPCAPPPRSSRLGPTTAPRHPAGLPAPDARIPPAQTSADRGAASSAESRRGRSPGQTAGSSRPNGPTRPSAGKRPAGRRAWTTPQEREEPTLRPGRRAAWLE